MKRLALLLCLLVFAPAAFTQTGFPLYGSFESGQIDSVNLSNLNVNFAIPLVSTPGRAQSNFGMTLFYNTMMWYPYYVPEVWTPMTPGTLNNWGWMTNLPLGTVTYQGTSSYGGCGHCIEGDCPGYTETDTQNNYTYIDPAGTPHVFNTISISSTYNSCTNNTTYLGTYQDYSSDGLYYLNLGGNPPTETQVWTSNGTKVDLGAITQTDANGNIVKQQYVSGSENDWIDTADRTSFRIITNSGNTEYHYYDPTGTDQKFVLKFQSYNVMTNFGCYSVSEYNASGTYGPVSLPYELDLPNGNAYKFYYETTPGHSSYTTARLTKITLPTGGYIEYQYGSYDDGINCGDGSVVSLTRIVNDGTNSYTWTYSRAGSGSNMVTTVTAPTMPYDSAANQYAYTYNSAGQLIEEQDYQGNVSGGTLLKTINTTWASNGSPATQVTILPGGQQSEVDTTYDTFGHLEQTVEYDWGSGGHGSTIRTTNLTYATISSLSPVGFKVVSEKTIKDGSGTVQWREDLGYDGSTPSCVTGQPEHDDTNYGCSYNTRGNLTSATTYTSPSVPSGGVTKVFTYDTFGNSLTAQVNCCQTKQLTFSSTTKYSEPDSVVSGPSGGPQLTVGATYNTYTGQIVSSTDPNSQTTSYAYDYMKRPHTITRPDSTVLTTTYNDTAFTVTQNTPVSSGGTAVNVVTAYDGLGRPLTSTTEDNSSTTYEIVQTNYDPAGRPYKVSNPYTGSASYWTQINFDGLGRVVKATLQDSSYATNSYSGNCVTAIDQAGKSRETCTDGSGRTAKVFEAPSGLDYETDYTFNVLDELTQVSQGVQTRSYTFDGIGRMTGSTTPEAGSFSYQYNSFNLVTQRTDARGVITSYSYDTLNRPYQITYNVGSTGVAAAPTVTYSYGSTPTSYNNGRLITVSDSVTGSESYSYNQLGEITQVQRVVGSNTYNTYYAYNLAGEVTQLTYPSGRVVAQTYDAIGRMCAIGASGSNCSSGTTYVTGYGYNIAQQVTGFTYGNGVQASVGYSSDRSQLSSLAYTSGGTTLLNLGYSYGSSSSNNGQVASITDYVDNGRSVSYTYDSLSRLSTAITAGSSGYAQWGLSWSYDRYGNRTAQTVTAGSAPSNSLSFATTSGAGAYTNRPDGYSFDANGNMLGDGTNSMTYDSENHSTNSSGTGGTAQYVYDGKGMRVEKCLSSCGSPTSFTVYIFAGSKVIAEYDNGAAVGSPSREYIYNGAQLVATINSSGMQYLIPDHFSVRVTTDSSGNKLGEQGHYPFGDQWYAHDTTTKWFFTSYERDAESGNDYAQARYNVNRLGRFASPDPISGDLSDPQSFNRYSYVRNRPLDFADPTGMYGCATADDWKHGAADHGSGPSADDPDSELAPQGGCGQPSCYSMDMGDTIPCGLLGIGSGGSGTGEAFDFSLNGIQLGGYEQDSQQNVGTYDDPTWETVSSWVQGLSLSSLLGLQSTDNNQPLNPLKDILNAPIQAKLGQLVSLLQNDPNCLNFLNGSPPPGGSDAITTLNQILKLGLYGQDALVGQPNGQGGYNVVHAQDSPTQNAPNAAIVVNSIGGFFNSSYFGQSITVNGFQGGTSGAQTSLLLHELSHIMTAPGIQPDANSSALGAANDKVIDSHCKSTISGGAH